MTFDLVVRNCSVAGEARPVDIAVRDGKIAAIGTGLSDAGPSHEAAGRFACSGLVDTHIHLDKACILDRCAVCEGTLAEAVRLSAAAKRGFTEDDVYARGSRVLNSAIGHGTGRMRSFVEVDPLAGLRSLHGLLDLRRDYRDALDLEICAFAQDGLTQEPETIGLLERALENGADLVGGCPYTDPDPVAHIRAIFDLAEAHGVAVDFHLDFDLEPHRSDLPTVIEEAERRNYGGRVSVGHVTRLSAVAPAELEATARRMHEAGIALIVLPATDLFLTGRDRDRLVPRGLAPAHRMEGVVSAIGTNNILNPFTPFGDPNLLRMANLYANVAQLASDLELSAVFDMVTTGAARLMGAGHGIAVGGPADIVLFDAPDAATAVRELSPAVAGWKRGRQTFRRPPVELFAVVDREER